METKEYYKVNGGPVRQLYDEFIKERECQYFARLQFAQEHGSFEILGTRSEVVGLVFPEKAPEGWRPIKGHTSCYSPPCGKVGKAIRQRMRSLPMHGVAEFHHRLHGDIGVFGGSSSGGLAIKYTFPEMIGDTLVLIGPEGLKWEPLPEGVERIKASEYWQLKEAQP